MNKFAILAKNAISHKLINKAINERMYKIIKRKGYLTNALKNLENNPYESLKGVKRRDKLLTSLGEKTDSQLESIMGNYIKRNPIPIVEQDTVSKPGLITKLRNLLSNKKPNTEKPKYIDSLSKYYDDMGINYDADISTHQNAKNMYNLHIWKDILSAEGQGIGTSPNIKNNIQHLLDKLDNPHYYQ